MHDLRRPAAEGFGSCPERAQKESQLAVLSHREADELRARHGKPRLWNRPQASVGQIPGSLQRPERPALLRAGTFARKGDATAWLASVQPDLRRGDSIDPSLGRITFGKWAIEWQRTTVDLRPSTRARDDTYLRTAILPWFEAMPIGQIDHLAVREWVAELNASRRAPATVVKAKQIMGKVMKTAVASNAIRTNPCSDVPLPRIEREEMRFLTPAEVGQLADAMDDRYAALVWLGAYGGLRAGELFALRVQRIDPLRRTIDVAESLVEVRGVHHFGPPKTKAARRRVPVPQFVADRLAEHVGRFQLQADSFAFPAPAGGPVRLSQWRRRFWHPAVHGAGLMLAA